MLQVRPEDSLRITIRRAVVAYIGTTTCVWLAGCTAPMLPPHGGTRVEEQRVHVVMDSGSSGTRLCAFEVKRAANGTCGHSPTSAPVCIRQAGGLAAATAALDPSAADQLVRERLEAAWARLVGAAPGLSATRSAWSAVALGTGGYRNPRTGAQDDRPSWKAVWSSASAFFSARGAQSAKAGAITGAQEGQLAWIGTGAVHPSFKQFAVLEIGGATAQHAWPSNRADGESRLQSMSSLNGLDAVFARLQGQPELQACFNTQDRSTQNADRCVALVRTQGLVGWPWPVDKALQDVFLLGASWGGTLTSYGRTSTTADATNAGVGSPAYLSAGDLHKLARRVCPSSDQEVLTWAPTEFNARNATGMACFTLSLQLASLQQLGYGPDTRLRFGGDDRWAAGAAISREWFPACRAENS